MTILNTIGYVGVVLMKAVKAWKNAAHVLLPVEMLLLAAVFWLLPPLVGFVVYFNFFHSARHLLRLAKYTYAQRIDMLPVPALPTHLPPAAFIDSHIHTRTGKRRLDRTVSPACGATDGPLRHCWWRSPPWPASSRRAPTSAARMSK
jgi:hypothetical protein